MVSVVSQRLVALPLCVLALALALIAFNTAGSERSELATKKAASKTHVKQTLGLQQLELAHVKKCARDITGSDKPRKLPPAQAKAVNECAKKFMPPPHTKAMLEAAARKVLAANHMKTDAQSVKKLMSAHKPAASAKTVGAAASRASAKVRLQHKAAK